MRQILSSGIFAAAALFSVYIVYDGVKHKSWSNVAIFSLMYFVYVLGIFMPV